MKKQRFLQAKAGVLRFTPPEGPLDTSSVTPTVTLYTPANATLQAEASASLTTIGTTIATTALVPGARALAVASGTGVAEGVRVWLGTRGAEPQELIKIRKWGTTSGELAEGCRFDHAVGQAVKGSEMTYALTTTHTATLDRNYRAVWKYSVDGTNAIYATQLFDVVAQIFRLQFSVQDLTPMIPEALRLGPREVHDLTDIIGEAEESLINVIEARGFKADRIRNPHQFDEVGKLGVLLILLGRARLTDSNYRQAWLDTQKAYDAALGAVFSSLDWYDADEDLSTGGSTDPDGTLEDGEEGDSSEEGVAVPLYFDLG